MKYIYSHINPETGKVFYVGAKMYDNDRINDTNNRNKLWINEVNKIGGFEKVIKRIEYIFPATAKISQIRSKEYEIANYYYRRGENYCSNESRLEGEYNPNYGNKWTDEQKYSLAQKMKGRYEGRNNPNYGNKWTKEQREDLSRKTKGRYRGKNNPNRKKCKLVFPNGNEMIFETKKEMIEWSREYLNSSLRTLKENIPHKFERRDLWKYNGIYFTILN